MLVVLSTVWKLEIKDLSDEQETSKTLSYYPPDLNRRRVSMLEKSDHMQVFIDKFYVKTSPTGYIYDADLDGAIPKLYDGYWTKDEIEFHEIYEQYKDVEKAADSKKARGDLHEKFETGGFHIEYREKTVVDEKGNKQKISLTFVQGVRHKKKVVEEEEATLLVESS
eukprot:SAG22_NODE_1646_length_3900_cov_8.380952_1_plen_167_part_00